MKRDRKEPLYRKEKKTGLQTRYYTESGGEARWDRNTKAAKRDAENEVAFQPINGRKGGSRQKYHKRRHEGIGTSGFGRDYTPLFRFLLSKVGKKWDDVYAEAKSRLDQETPIWWMVKKPVEHRGRYERDDNDPYVRIGEGSMWSKLTIDDDGILRKVDPEANSPFWWGCPCHTQSFNGVPYVPDEKANEKWNKDDNFGKPNRDKKTQG